MDDWFWRVFVIESSPQFFMKSKKQLSEREIFERTMKALFRVPKTNTKKPKKKGKD